MEDGLLAQKKAIEDLAQRLKAIEDWREDMKKAFVAIDQNFINIVNILVAKGLIQAGPVSPGGIFMPNGAPGAPKKIIT